MTVVLHRFLIDSSLFQVRGSLARKALRELLSKGLIRQVVAHNAQSIYTRVIKEEDEGEAEKEKTEKK